MKGITIMTLTTFVSLILAGTGSPTLAIELQPERDKSSSLTTGQAVEGQLLVKFKSAPTIAYESEIAIPIPFTAVRIRLREAGFAVRGNRSATNVTKKLRVQAMRVLGQSDPAKEIALVQLPAGGDEQAAVDQYKKASGVEVAELNYLVSGLTSLFTPNDPYFQRTPTQDYQWNFYAIDMLGAWNVPPVGEGGSPFVKIAVIDSGVAFATHTIHGQQFVQAPELSTVNFVAPKRFESLSPDCTTPLPSPEVDDHPHDQSGHGTHVTATIVQATNNAQHAAGIAFNTSIIPIKALTTCTQPAGETRGAVSDIISGINHAVTNGADVINMSLGLDQDSPSLHHAITAAVNAGVTVVASTGNAATKTSSPPVIFPAAYPEVIAVGATRFDGKRAEYSQYGPELDLVAPGAQIFTDSGPQQDQCIVNAPTLDDAIRCIFLDQNSDFLPDGIVQQTIVHGQPTQFTSILPPSYPTITQFRCIQTDFQSVWIDERCGLFNGTSMAAPHVSAAAALILSVNSNLTPAQVKDILTSTASKTAIPGYTQTEHGAGLLDVNAALAAASGGTGTPTPTVTPGGNVYTLDLFPPTGNVVMARSDTEDYAVYATLKQNGVVVTNQQDFSYYWISDNPAIVTVSPFDVCTFGIQPPCPFDHTHITDRSIGSTSVRVVVTKISLNHVVATGTFVVSVVASLTPSPTPTSAGSPTPRPSGWTTTESFQLLVGDVNDTNTITIEDVSAVLTKYTDFKVPVLAGSPEDVNADGFVTIEDVALVLLNYNDFTVPGDTP